MKIRDHAVKTAKEVLSALDLPASDEERVRKVADIVEEEMIRIALETRNWCADRALALRGTDAAEANRLSEKLRQETEVLITNLSSLR